MAPVIAWFKLKKPLLVSVRPRPKNPISLQNAQIPWELAWDFVWLRNISGEAATFSLGRKQELCWVTPVAALGMLPNAIPKVFPPHHAQGQVNPFGCARH